MRQNLLKSEKTAEKNSVKKHVRAMLAESEVVFFLGLGKARQIVKQVRRRGINWVAIGAVGESLEPSRLSVRDRHLINLNSEFSEKAL